MKPLLLLAAAACIASASGFAYDAPSESVQDSIRAYSDPGRLGFVLILSSNCGLDREATEASAEGEFIRSRVDKLPIPDDDWELFLVAARWYQRRPDRLHLFPRSVEKGERRSEDSRTPHFQTDTLPSCEISPARAARRRMSAASTGIGCGAAKSVPAAAPGPTGRPFRRPPGPPRRTRRPRRGSSPVRVPVTENRRRRQPAARMLLAFPDARHQRFRIGSAGQLDELHSEVFLQRPPGRRGPGSRLHAGSVRHITNGNRPCHAGNMQAICRQRQHDAT